MNIHPIERLTEDLVLWKHKPVEEENKIDSMFDLQFPNNFFKELHSHYRNVNKEKKTFVDTTEKLFVSFKLPMEAKTYSRELFLEAVECENSIFMLPPLTRESFSKKDVFYWTEKIIY